MNISEFERNKPVATMKALNSLISELRDMDKEGHSCNPAWCVAKLEEIKILFKYGA